MSVTRQGIGIGAAHSEGSRVPVTISQGIINERLGVNLPDQVHNERRRRREMRARQSAASAHRRQVDNPLTHIKPIEAGPRKSQPKDANNTPH